MFSTLDFLKPLHVGDEVVAIPGASEGKPVARRLLVADRGDHAAARGAPGFDGYARQHAAGAVLDDAFNRASRLLRFGRRGCQQRQ